MPSVSSLFLFFIVLIFAAAILRQIWRQYYPQPRDHARPDNFVAEFNGADFA